LTTTCSWICTCLRCWLRPPWHSLSVLADATMSQPGRTNAVRPSTPHSCIQGGGGGSSSQKNCTATKNMRPGVLRIT
jgi:hypothetical protein